MTVPDYIISLGVLEEQKYRERRYATACDLPRGSREDQSGPAAAARKRLRPGLRTLAFTSTRAMGCGIVALREANAELDRC
jgi:hypothetical protein